MAVIALLWGSGRAVISVAVNILILVIALLWGSGCAVISATVNILILVISRLLVIFRLLVIRLPWSSGGTGSSRGTRSIIASIVLFGLVSVLLTSLLPPFPEGLAELVIAHQAPKEFMVLAILSFLIITTSLVRRGLAITVGSLTISWWLGGRLSWWLGWWLSWGLGWGLSWRLSGISLLTAVINTIILLGYITTAV